MALRKKIDSNETSLSYAFEVLGAPGTLPVTPDWFPAEPNEYDDFGGQIDTIARRPINSSRQRKKGSATGVEAGGGFNQDLTHDNSQKLIAAAMYAAPREKPTAVFDEVTATGFVVPDESIFFAGMLVFVKGSAVSGNNGLKLVTGVDSGDSEVLVTGLAADGAPASDASITVVGFQFAAGTLDVVTTGDFARFTSSTTDLTTLGTIAGEFIFVGGDGAGEFFSTAANNGLKRLYSTAAGAWIVDKSQLPMVAEASTTETIRVFFGRVIKNELEDLIVKQSLQLERKLGAPDTAQPTQRQAEYIKGAFPNELDLHVEAKDKVNFDISFVGLDNEFRKAADGVKSGNRHTLDEADCYNTSTDFSGLRMALFNGSDEAPTPLFAYMLDFDVSINNNVSVDEAVAVFGGFDVTLGLFEVGLEATCYFNTVEAVEAVRNNADVTFHGFLAKDNKGVVFDLPLGSLGDARADVELDEPIRLPITMDAATAVKLNPGSDYTCMWVFFDYLPNAAEAINPIV